MTLLKFYDRNLNAVGQPIQEPEIRQARQRPNAADYGTFTLPSDIEHQEQLKIASYVALSDQYNQVISGYIEGRDLSGNEYSFTVQGHAHRLKRYKTPTNWTAWNSRDLADVVRDHLLQFKSERWNTQSDWEAVELHQVDITTEPGAVILEYEPHPEDPENERPVASGYVQVKKDLGSSALSLGRIARWTETIGAETRVTIQSRASATEAGLATQAWGPEMTAVHVDEIQENETSGVPIAGGGRWVEVRVNLYTEDQETPHRESGNNVTGYGYTPYLDGLELIWREPTFMEAGNIPESTGVIVQGFEFQRQDFLQSLCELCNEYEWEFKLRHDEERKQVLLDLGEQTGSTWEPKFGISRTRDSDMPLILEHGRNATVTVLRDNTNNLANILDCFGSGQGASQLYVQLKDDGSIDDNGEFPDDFSVPEADTMTKLIEAGQAELAKRSQPEATFEVQVPIDSLEELGGVKCGDTITVIHPRSQAIIDARILEYGYQSSASEKKIKLGLNAFLLNPVERLISKKPSSKTLGEIPATPKQVTAVGKYAYNVVTWASDADLWAVRLRTDNGLWQYRDTKTNEFVHTQLAVNSTWEYQVAAIKNKRMSDWSTIVTATVSDIPPEDVGIDTTPPEPASYLQVNENTYMSRDGVIVITAALVWQASESPHAHQQFIERAEGQGSFRPLVTLDKGAQTYLDTQALEPDKTYTWRVSTISGAGVYSENNPTVDLTIEGKADALNAPTNLTAFIDSDANVSLSWHHVNAAQLKDYHIEIAEDVAFTQGVKSFYSLTNHFPLTGMYADERVYVRIFARDRSGGEGAPSNVVTVDMPELLNATIKEYYLAKERFQTLLDTHFYGDEEGYFDGKGIRPNTLETQAVAVGSPLRAFMLSGVTIEPNADNTKKWRNTSGYLVQLEGDNYTINALTATLVSGLYYVYARVHKTVSNTTNNQFVFESTKRTTHEEGDYYYFAVGIYDTSGEAAKWASGYGYTVINGGQITTGEIDAEKVSIISPNGELKFGNLGGKPWGEDDNLLPPDVFGIWGESAGLYLRGYAKLIVAGSAEDEQEIDLSDFSNLTNPEVLVAPKELVSYSPERDTLSHLYVDAVKVPNQSKYIVKAKTMVKGTSHAWGGRSETHSSWTFTRPTGSTDGKKGVYTDFFICRPYWRVASGGAGLYTARLWMDITDEFNANGDPINWENIRTFSRSSSGSGTLNWDTALPYFGQWALRVRGNGGGALIIKYAFTRLVESGYRTGDTYLDVDGRVITNPEPANSPSGMSALYFVFDKG